MDRIDTKQEIRKITEFIKKTLNEQGIKNVVIGLSGGVDSATSFNLLSQSIPAENIIVAHLYYEKSLISQIEKILRDKKILAENIYNLSIKEPVDQFKKQLGDENIDKVRIGNIIARSRMVILYDLAKKYNALVCGTENKSEHYLGYFTRFGDEASDFEPIRHLYKTQVFQLAKALSVPEEIVNQRPTAGLWEGQYDEDELGFNYEEADKILYLYFEKGLSLDQINKKGLNSAEKVINFAKKNSFKHKTPYLLKK